MISRNPKIFSAEESKGKFGIWESEPSIYSLACCAKSIFPCILCKIYIFTCRLCKIYSIFPAFFAKSIYYLSYWPKSIYSLEYCAKSIFPWILCQIYFPLHVVQNLYSLAYCGKSSRKSIYSRACCAKWHIHSLAFCAKCIYTPIFPSPLPPP